MAVLVVGDDDGAGRWQDLDDAGLPAGPVRTEPDLAAFVADREAADRPRWVLADAAQDYPPLLAAGLRLRRCHDLALTEALLLGHSGHWGAPRALAAAHARLHDRPAPADPPAVPRSTQATLFDVGRRPLPGGADAVGAAQEVYAAQLAQISAVDNAGAFGLLVAAESASALVAVEMSTAGLPWRSDVHDDLLLDLLGGRPISGARPPKLAALAVRISDEFGGIPVNPDSPASVLNAFARSGVMVDSTHSWVLRRTGHPAVEPLIAYRELSRILTTHGWTWRAEWVRGGRFRPEFVPGGVVSGRWATRGGGGLQLPRRLRSAVIAEPGHTLVVADAGQLEPRVLAAMSGDPAMMRAAGEADMYAALAAEAFGGDRAAAKLGLLGAMYGQTGGAAALPLATLRRRYPVALDLLERAARTGEQGGLVRSHLGRTCPPPSVDVSDGAALTTAAAGELDLADPPAGASDDGSADRARTAQRDGARARSRGRFTRNFVVQATAAEWMAAVLAALRLRLLDRSARSGQLAEMVFFQHDEVIVHAPIELAEVIATDIGECAREATALLFRATPVRLLLEPVIARGYDEAAH